MEYLIGWALFGVAGYTIAKSKGRNPYLWAVFGLLIGPFALLIIAFLPTTDKGDKAYL